MAELVDLMGKVFLGKIEHKLHRQVLEDVEPILLAIGLHVLVKEILGSKLIVSFEMVDHLPLAMYRELVEVAKSRYRSPFEVENGQMLFLQFTEVLSSLQDASNK